MEMKVKTEWQGQERAGGGTRGDGGGGPAHW